MTGWFDIGVNLTNPRLTPEQVIQNATNAGVSHLAVTGTDIEESRAAQELVKQFPQHLVSTAGVHPHYAKDVSTDFVDELAELASSDSAVAIGECGLDFNRNFSPPEAQLEVFEKQLQLAQALSMPVFLHERDAFEQQISLLKQYLPGIPAGVAHCFTGNLEQMQGYIELGLYIGITGWLCDPKRGKALREAVTQLPLEHVVLETDAPYLMPKTLKNKQHTNEPANLPHIGDHLAELMEVERDTLRTHSFQNSLRLFGMEA